MLQLKFESPMGGSPVTVGPAPYFRVGGNMMHLGSDRRPVAEYKNHSWEIEGKHHTRYVADGRAVIYFENLMGDATEPFGPFTECSASDGVVYADGQLFAKFVEETQLWHCFPTDTYWPTIVIAAP